MKAAVGGSYLLYIVVFFVSVVILLFASVLSYSKAYRVKNKIIDMIEKNEVYSDDIKDSIGEILLQYGYKTVASESGISCKFNKTCDGGNLNTTTLNYCVCKHSDSNGVYYEVITYGYMEFPIIKSLLKFTVHGETRTLAKNYNYD